MDRASSTPAESSLPQAGQTSGLRKFSYAVLVVLVATGAWVRFSDNIARWAPGLTPPGHVATQSDRVRALLELRLVPAAATAEAVQAMNLPAGDQSALQAEIARKRVRLVQLPVFEGDGGTGAALQVNANGLMQVVHLAAKPVVLTIPMAQTGNVSFRLISTPGTDVTATGVPPGSVGIGAITLTGPLALPVLAPGQVLEVGVVAQ